MSRSKTAEGFEVIRTKTGLSITLDGSLSQDKSPQVINLGAQYSAQLAEDGSIRIKTAIGEVQIDSFESSRDARHLLDEIADCEKKSRQSPAVVRYGVLLSLALLSWSAASLTTWQLAGDQMDAVITSIADRVETAAEARAGVAAHAGLSPAVARPVQAAEGVEQRPAPKVTLGQAADTAGEWRGRGGQ